MMSQETRVEYRQLGKSGLRVSVPIVSNANCHSISDVTDYPAFAQIGGMAFGDPRWSVRIPWTVALVNACA